jgi:hypothetical protein
MGEIADYYRTWEQDEDSFVGQENKIPREKMESMFNPNWVTLHGPIWITGTLKRIPIHNMTTKHILHTIRAWLGLGKTTPPEGWCGGKDIWLDLLTEELLRRDKLR